MGGRLHVIFYSLFPQTCLEGKYSSVWFILVFLVANTAGARKCKPKLSVETQRRRAAALGSWHRTSQRRRLG